MCTQFCGTDRVIWNSYMISAVVETPTTWRLLNLLTSDITSSDWLQKIRDTSACALTLPSCQMKNNYYERSRLTSFGPFFTARRVCIVRIILSHCKMSVCPSVTHTYCIEKAKHIITLCISLHACNVKHRQVYQYKNTERSELITGHPAVADPYYYYYYYYHYYYYYYYYY